MVAAASFADDAAAEQAISILSASDVRPEEISVIARDAARAARIADDRAWYPGRDDSRLAKLMGRLARRRPREIRPRSAKEPSAGRLTIDAAARAQRAARLPRHPP